MDIIIYQDIHNRIYLDLNYPKFILQIVTDEGVIIYNTCFNELNNFNILLKKKLEEFMDKRK